MAGPLLDLFVRERSSVVTFDGMPLYSVYLVEDAPRTSARLRWRTESGPLVQGIQVDAMGGRLRVAGQLLTKGVIWQDTAPPVVDLELVPKRGAETMRLALRNCWRGEDGRMQASLGNAGMRASWDGSRLRLDCSDGVGDVDFTDVVVEIEFDEPPRSLPGD